MSHALSKTRYCICNTLATMFEAYLVTFVLIFLGLVVKPFFITMGDFAFFSSLFAFVLWGQIFGCCPMGIATACAFGGMGIILPAWLLWFNSACESGTLLSILFGPILVSFFVALMLLMTMIGWAELSWERGEDQPIFTSIFLFSEFFAVFFFYNYLLGNPFFALLEP